MCPDRTKWETNIIPFSMADYTIWYTVVAVVAAAAVAAATATDLNPCAVCHINGFSAILHSSSNRHISIAYIFSPKPDNQTCTVFVYVPWKRRLTANFLSLLFCSFFFVFFETYMYYIIFYIYIYFSIIYSAPFQRLFVFSFSSNACPVLPPRSQRFFFSVVAAAAAALTRTHTHTLNHRVVCFASTDAQRNGAPEGG